MQIFLFSLKNTFKILKTRLTIKMDISRSKVQMANNIYFFLQIISKLTPNHGTTIGHAEQNSNTLPLNKLLLRVN